jgi:hypothetical protein
MVTTPFFNVMILSLLYFLFIFILTNAYVISFCYSYIKTGNNIPMSERDDAGESLLAMNEIGEKFLSGTHASHHSLIRTLIRLFGWEFLLFHLLAMIRVACKMISPQLLR